MTDEVVVKTPPCIQCGKPSYVKMTREQYVRLQESDRPHIQDIFPDWDANKRELFITGTHGKCWDAMFLEEDYEDDDD